VEFTFLAARSNRAGRRDDESLHTATVEANAGRR
jgi:hypothetical protein